MPEKLIFVKKKNSCRGFHPKKNPAQAMVKKNMQKHYRPPPPSPLPPSPMMRPLAWSQTHFIPKAVSGFEILQIE